MKKISLYLGPIIFILIVFVLPIETTFAIKGALGTFVWMILWWIFTPVHITVTAFLPIIVNALFAFVSLDVILSKYAHPLVVLLIGANIITISWQATGLNKRIALKGLSLVGSSVKQQIVVWFSLATLLSIFLPNIVVAASLSPIALSMLNYVDIKDMKSSKVAANILIAIAWGSGLGGFGTPLGGGMNLVAIDFLEEIKGSEYLFIDWTVRMIPMLLLIALPILIYMLSFKNEFNELNGSKEFYKTELSKLGRMKKEELISALLFGSAILLSFLRPYYAQFLPNFSPPYMFLTIGMLAFVLPGKMNGRLLTFDFVVPKMSWGLYYLVAGGLALGAFITVSGSALEISRLVATFNLTGNIATIAIFVGLAMLLSNVSSNTASCAISIPFVISIVNGIGLNPIPYVYITIAAANSAYVLPTSTRAIPIANGVNAKYMFNKGVGALLISFVVIVVLGSLFINLWPMYSI